MVKPSFIIIRLHKNSFYGQYKYCKYVWQVKEYKPATLNGILVGIFCKYSRNV